eukprot:5722153-Prymnesium_polylepis.1
MTQSLGADCTRPPGFLPAPCGAGGHGPRLDSTFLTARRQRTGTITAGRTWAHTPTTQAGHGPRKAG